MSFAIARTSPSNGYLEFFGGGRWWPNPKCLFGNQIHPTRSGAVQKARDLEMIGEFHFVDVASEVAEYQDKGVYELASRCVTRTVFPKG